MQLKQSNVYFRESGESEYLISPLRLLSEGFGTSPAQRFLGRRCKTLLPTTTSRLQPAFPTGADAQARTHQRQRQQVSLKPIPVGETKRLRLPGQATWSTGTCKGLVGPRSYDVQVGEKIYQRNRRQLIYANEPLLTSSPLVDQHNHNHQINRLRPPILMVPLLHKKWKLMCPQQIVSQTLHYQLPRRSGRTTKAPKWMEDYVPS